MNAKIVEPQSLRRGFRQSFHILDYFFIPVDTMHNKPISDKRKGNGTPIINFLSTFSYYTKEKEAFGPANIRNR
jgi:hypothetical protein